MLKAMSISLILLISCAGLSSCDGESNNEITCESFPDCNWDSPIKDALAKDMLINWQKKWLPTAGVPDSFLINSVLLETISEGYCGFRAYPGLTSAGDISSMGVVIVPVDETRSDVIPDDGKVLFSNISSASESGTNGNYISLAVAQGYTQNWRLYNGVCRADALMGNSTCPIGTTEPTIPPRGNYGPDTIQVIPLALVFATQDVFCTLEEEGDFPDYVIYNSMYRITSESEPGSEFLGYGFDMYIRGADITQNRLSEAIDITSPCPWDCGDSSILQGGS